MKIGKVRAKNFLALGEAWTEIDLEKYDRSVIHGKNGGSKSSIINFITFGLFDKTIKTLTRGQIVNSVNRKGTVVEINFKSDDGKQYLVRRGIKPTLFEIFEEGVLLDQTLKGDAQAYLETHILKTNFRTFLQTAVLSIEYYKPFMTLNKAERRGFVEDILDIRVFTHMNVVTKASVAQCKDQLQKLDVRSATETTKAKMQFQQIQLLESRNLAGTAAIHDRISAAQADVQKHELEILKLSSDHDDLKLEQEPLRALIQTQSENANRLVKLDTEISRLKNELEQHCTATHCGSCKQQLPTDAHGQRTAELQGNIDRLSGARGRFVDGSSELNSLNEKFRDLNQRISDISQNLHASRMLHSSATRLVDSGTAELNSLKADSDIANMRAELKSTAKLVLDIKTEREAIQIRQDYNLAMLELFKDGGIKSKIIEQYLPVINTLVNNYLEKLDFFVSFHLDSEFNETLKSRHRDDFCYSNFSAGERQRIDLALMFTFRELARRRNSFDCNLLFLDEVLECLDAEGVENLLKILDVEIEFQDSNVFIISHKSKDLLIESFNGNYEAIKQGNFSVIVEH